ncbi:UNVERIFIED_CONTAM: Gag-Pol polyprotein [Sesamum indicum]
MGKFGRCSVLQVPRVENDKADALSKFGAAMDGIRDRKITALVREQSALASRTEVQVVSEAGSWMNEIVRYLEDGTLPSDPVAAKRVRFRAARFTLLEGQLYKRTVDGPLLKCLDEERALGEIASSESNVTGVFLAHPSRRCQELGEKIPRPDGTNQDSVSVRSVGNRHRGTLSSRAGTEEFIIVAVEYFFKWVEAEAVAKISEKEVINFIWKNIICRFGIPRILISDNGTQFQGRKITEWCKELKIAQHFTAVANPQANG